MTTHHIFLITIFCEQVAWYMLRAIPSSEHFITIFEKSNLFVYLRNIQYIDVGYGLCHNF